MQRTMIHKFSQLGTCSPESSGVGQQGRRLAMKLLSSAILWARHHSECGCRLYFKTRRQQGSTSALETSVSTADLQFPRSSLTCTKWLGVSLQTEWICPFTMGIILAKGRLTLDRLKTNHHSSYFLNAHTGIRHVNHKSVHTSFKNTYRNILVENQNVTSSSKNNSYSWFYEFFSGNFYTSLHFLFFFNL